MTVDLDDSYRPAGLEEPIRISWSGLKRWENCRQLQLRTIKGQSTKSEYMGRIFLPGTIVDRVQRRWLEEEDPQPGQMEQWVVETIAEHTAPGAEYKIKWIGNPKEDKKRLLDDCVEAVRNLEPILNELVLPYDYQPEVKFNAHMQVPYLREGRRAPVTLFGGIDIVVLRQTDGGFRVYDLKTTRNDKYVHGETLAQLTFYALAWGIIHKDFAQPFECAFITPLTEEKVINVTVTEEDKRLLLSRVIKYSQGVWADNWAPKSDDTGCQYCEAKANCAKFRVPVIEDEHGRQRMSFAAAAAQKSKFRDQKSA